MKNMRKMNKLGAYAVAFVFLGAFVALSGFAGADSSNVTVTWIIPADTSVTITYPTGEGKIVFEPASKTFTGQTARSQNTSTSGMNIENIGNTALQINFTFAGEWYDAGLTFFNCSVGDDSNTTLFYWTNSNETANHTVYASLAVANNEDFWFFAAGTDCLESAVGEDEEIFEVWYTNA